MKSGSGMFSIIIRGYTVSRVQRRRSPCKPMSSMAKFTPSSQSHDLLDLPLFLRLEGIHSSTLLGNRCSSILCTVHKTLIPITSLLSQSHLFSSGELTAVHFHCFYFQVVPLIYNSELRPVSQMEYLQSNRKRSAALMRAVPERRRLIIEKHHQQTWMWSCMVPRRDRINNEQIKHMMKQQRQYPKSFGRGMPM